MSSYLQFNRELHVLARFYKATLYSYEQTDYLLFKCRKEKESMAILGFTDKPPSYYKIKGSGISENQKNLFEITFVRFVSALEVFLVDQVRDVFIQTKEPFKKQNSKPEFSQAELLSMKSPADIFDKIINKETRKLSSGGFNEIIKYYKEHFQINLADISPGKKKMEEYHQRRHLLVHRLGKTDQQYRDKYNCSSSRISIDELYLTNCFEDFKNFAEILNNQLKERLQVNFSTNKTKVKPESTSLIIVEVLKGQPNIFDNNYEFWAGDQLCMFTNILDQRTNESDKKFKIAISGSAVQISSYGTILKKEVDRGKIKVEYLRSKENSALPTPKKRLDFKTISLIKEKLPEQPWQTGIHKIIAEELGLSNKIVTKTINYLVKNGHVIIKENR